MSESSGVKRVVLVIEDDDDVRSIVVRALSATYTVQSAVDGNAALKLLATMAPPDAVVCDVMMPGIDGLELAKRIKATPTWSRVPILFLTARGGVADVAAGINAGARHYVVKPFKIADLVAKVERMVKPGSR
jgi:DNA-binding response OmpR family regulator